VADDLAEPVVWPEASHDLALRSEVLSGDHREGRWWVSLLLTDGDGVTLPGDERAFSAFVAGEPVPIEAGPLSQGLALAVVVDEAVAARTLDIVRALVAGLRSPSEIAVYRVAGEVAVVAPFGHPAPLDALNTPAPGTGRRLFDGLTRAFADTAQRAAPLRAVLLVAAGADEGSEAGLASVRAASAGVGLFAVGTGAATPAWMAGFADAHRYHPEPLAFGSEVASMGALLSSTWQVAVTAPSDVVVDVRYLGEGTVRELSFPTDR